MLREQDEDEEFEVGDEKRDVEQEYKEIIDWLNDVEQRASLMAQQWSEDSEEDETKKKRKAVSLGLLIIVYAQNDSIEDTHGAYWFSYKMGQVSYGVNVVDAENGH